jgi:hypothetical protein
MSELTLDGLKDMKKADYIKAFKNKAAWKKAKAVIILVDYKLEGKKAVIAIPFKKENEMKLEMKRLKKEKIHLLKKSGGGSINIEVGADGEREAKIELGIGGLKPELLLLKAGPLFEKIKLKIQATQNEEAKADAATSEGEVDVNENLPEDSLDDVTVEDSEEDEEKEISTKKNILKTEGSKITVIEDALTQIKNSALKLMSIKDTLSSDKISENLRKLNEALTKLKNHPKLGENEHKTIVEIDTILVNISKSTQTLTTDEKSSSMDNDMMNKMNEVEVQKKENKAPNKEELKLDLKDIYNKTEELCKKLGLDLNAFKN